MIAKLSDELVDELQRAGDAPLAVENPRNHKRYLIVAEERYVGSPRESAAGSWTESKNARRFFLIDKQIAGTLTADEAVELTRLSIEIDDYLRRVAPLPLAATRQLHEQLRRRLADAKRH
jgi:hypothetical protein